MIRRLLLVAALALSALVLSPSPAHAWPVHNYYSQPVDTPIFGVLGYHCDFRLQFGTAGHTPYALMFTQSTDGYPSTGDGCKQERIQVVGINLYGTVFHGDQCKWAYVATFSVVQDNAWSHCWDAALPTGYNYVFMESLGDLGGYGLEADLFICNNDGACEYDNYYALGPP